MDKIKTDSIAGLKQGLILFQKLTDEQYRYSSPEGLGDSIGKHIRHNIDHYFCLIGSWKNKKVDYDARERDRRIEEDLEFASANLHTIIKEIENISDEDLHKPIDIKMDSGEIDKTSSPIWCRSTLRREFQFLCSHTTHHYALIAILCRMQDIDPGTAFGVSPSTLRYNQEKAVECVR